MIYKENKVVRCFAVFEALQNFVIYSWEKGNHFSTKWTLIFDARFFRAVTKLVFFCRQAEHATEHVQTEWHHCSLFLIGAIDIEPTLPYIWLIEQKAEIEQEKYTTSGQCKFIYTLFKNTYIMTNSFHIESI